MEEGVEVVVDVSRHADGLTLARWVTPSPPSSGLLLDPGEVFIKPGSSLQPWMGVWASLVAEAQEPLALGFFWLLAGSEADLLGEGGSVALVDFRPRDHALSWAESRGVGGRWQTG